MATTPTSPGPLPTPVVGVDWLREAMTRDDGRPVVLDVRWTLRPPPKTAKERKAAAREDPPGLVLLKTGFGGTRIIDLLVGDPLPRIC